MTTTKPAAEWIDKTYTTAFAPIAPGQMTAYYVGATPDEDFTLPVVGWLTLTERSTRRVTGERRPLTGDEFTYIAPAVWWDHLVAWDDEGEFRFTPWEVRLDGDARSYPEIAEGRERHRKFAKDRTEFRDELEWPT